MLADTWEEDFYEYVESNPLTLCSGLVYRNRYNRLQNAQRMNALVFDLDGVGERELRNLLLRFGKPAEWIRTLPMPTFLVASGAGLHVYYVFEDPVDLYLNIKLQLKALKYDLTFRMWEYKATSTRKEIQYQSIRIKYTCFYHCISKLIFLNTAYDIFGLYLFVAFVIKQLDELYIC